MTRRRMWPIAIAVLAASVVVPVGLASAEVLKLISPYGSSS